MGDALHEPAVAAAGLRALLIAAACLTGACAGEDSWTGDPGAPEVESQVAPLWANSQNAFWPSGTIPVCIHPNSTGKQPGTPEFDNFAASLREQIEAAYENIPYAKIDFTGWGLCDDWESFTMPDQANGVLRVVVSTAVDAAFYRHCAPGFDYSLTGSALATCGGVAGYSSTMHPVLYVGQPYGCFPGGALHEAGHALGFEHEFDRRHEGGACQTAGADDSTGEFVTNYDDDSIMNSTYCGGRCTNVLSDGDKLGLSLVYPDGLTRTVHASRGFTTGSGSIIMRDNDRLVTEWTHRGAAASAFTTKPSWWSDTTLVGQDYVLEGSALPYGSSIVHGAYTDFRDRHNLLAATSVDVNNARHAAVIVALK